MSQSELQRAGSLLPQALLREFCASTTTYSYAGNSTTVTDPAGKWKTFTSDVLGNLTTVTEPNPAGGTFTTSYTYDWMNHLVGSSMTRGSTTQTRTFVYNSAGQLTSATNPESGTVAYTYNTDTTLAQKTDAKGQVSVYTYDSAKRITETQIYPAGLSYGEDVCQRVTYVYDAGTNGAGHLTSVAYGEPYSVWAGGGGCPGTAGWRSYQEAYTYDPVGGVTGKTFTTWVPSSLGGWTTSASIGISYTYDTAGRLSTATYPTTTSYSTPPTYTYGYDGMGRPASMTDNTTNPYTGVGVPWVQNGTYDPAGHMTSMAPAIDPTTNRLTSGYDANGNMLTGYGLTLTYDERNRLASASPTSSATEYYGYAPDNKRIYRWNPTTGTEEWTFYGARGERIGAFALYDGSGMGDYFNFVATETNVWFGGKLISKMAGGYLTSVERDRLGSDREAGAYYPYGEDIVSTPNGTEKFGTYVRDSFTMLDYADQRYYTAAYGRFNTADPSHKSINPRNPGSWNRYAYVGGDPVNRFDPRGLCVTDSQGNYWDNGDDVAYDWGVGDCEQNPEWISMANGAAPGTVMLNGGLYLPGGDSVSVTDDAPCVPYAASPSGATGCESDDPILQLAQQLPTNTLNNLMDVLGVGAAAPIVGAQALVAEAGNTILLGTFADGYVNLGGVVGASTFSIPSSVWADMALIPGSQWAANQAFLDAAIGSNAVIVLGSNAANAVEGTGFWQEIQYLESQGFQVSSDGTQMIKP